jgi:hypothetical protein
VVSEEAPEAAAPAPGEPGPGFSVMELVGASAGRAYQSLTILL